MARRIGSMLLLGVVVLVGAAWWLRSSQSAAEPTRAEIEAKAESVRESVLSIALPAPPFSGRKQVIMSKRFGGD